jgi:hypothetical protein
MSSKALFKPFVHKKYGSFSIDRATEPGNPLPAAIKEFESSPGVGYQPRFDTILSLGCCVAQTGQENQERQPKPQQTVYTRFHVLANDVPKVDDISCISSVQELVRRQISAAEVQDVVSRLFANLFYVEPNDSVAEISDCKILVQGTWDSNIHASD